MNLLKCYIKEIYSEEEYHPYFLKDDKGDGIKFVLVDLEYNCCGQYTRKKQILKEEDWKEIKRKGYFLG